MKNKQKARKYNKPQIKAKTIKLIKGAGGSKIDGNTGRFDSLF